MSTESVIRLALDAQGGDHGPQVTVAAAIDALEQFPSLEITLVGLQEAIERELRGQAEQHRDRIRLLAAASVLESGIGPVGAIRHGNRSSMGRSLELLSLGEVDACVSAGSTTALMALGMKMIGVLEGLKRPALMTRIPTATGFTSMLDLGANLNVDATQLVQFAIMGSVAHARDGGPARIGLLNVGHEDSKGHSVVKHANERLASLPLDYHGFIEGDEVFTGKVDVAVCDGFTGNLVLKSSEGLARMLIAAIKQGLDSSWRARLGAGLAGPALRETLARFDPAQHNGAPLLGLNGVVVKSHGSAGKAATVQAIAEAVSEAGKHVPEHIRDLVKTYEAETES